MGWGQGGPGAVPLPSFRFGMERCGVCGWENPAGFRYCGNCRTLALRPPVTAPLPPPPPPPPPPATAAPPSPPPTPVPSRPPEATAPAPAAPAPATAPTWGSSVLLPWATPTAPTPRTPPLPRGLSYLLRMDADGRFDLFGLNSLSLSDVLHEAERADHETLRRLAKEAELLLPRVRKETGSREDVTQLLRLLAERWYLESATTPAPPGRPPWRTWATAMWGGLFYESRVPGGSRTPRLADRLLWISEGKAGPHPARWHLLFGGSADEDASPTLNGRPPEEVLLLRVAQSILDDLAETPRGTSPTVVLPRLTDLAESTSSRDVNAALQALLPTYDADSFLLLDPIRTPGVALGTLRWPRERGTGGTSAYQLQFASGTDEATGAVSGEPLDASVGSLRFYLPKWFGPSRTPSEWIEILRSLADKQVRLPPPPSADCRQNAGYRSLRSALVGGPPATDLFDQVCWRGRPRDLPLFNRLMKDGSYTPDEETDSGYLEAELNDLAFGDPRHGADDGVWTLDVGKRVRRARAPDGSLRYTVEAGPGPDPGAGPSGSAGPVPPAAPSAPPA